MKYSERLNILANNLRKSEKINSFDSAKEKEADTLAHSFLDIQESCNVLTSELFPKLMSSNISESEIEELLFDIGEELRHIKYHIKDPRFYEYLQDQ